MVPVCWLAFVHVLRTRVTKEEGTSTEELPQSDWLVGVLVEAFSYLLLMLEGPAHCG